VTTNRHTPSLDALRATMARLHGRWTINLIPAETDSVLKLAYLKETGRDFAKVTPELIAAVTDHVATKVHAQLANPDAIDPLALLRSAGEVVRAHIVNRFVLQGVDVALRPLSDPYKLFKRRHRLDPRIGVAWGTLLRDIKLRARVLVRRTG